MALELNAWTRSATGKGAARKLRAEGRVPAIVYGVELKPLVVDAQDCSRLVNEGALGRLVHLRLQDAGETKTVLFRTCSPSVRATSSTLTSTNLG